MKLFLFLSVLVILLLGVFIMYLGPAIGRTPVANKAQIVLPKSMRCLKCHTNCYQEFPENLPLFHNLGKPNYDQK